MTVDAGEWGRDKQGMRVNVEMKPRLGRRWLNQLLNLDKAWGGSNLGLRKRIGHCCKCVDKGISSLLLFFLVVWFDEVNLDLLIVLVMLQVKR